MLKSLVIIILSVTVIGCAIPLKSEDRQRFDNMQASMDAVSNNIRSMTSAALILGQQMELLNAQIGSIDTLNIRLLTLNSGILLLAKEFSNLKNLSGDTALLAKRLKSLQDELAKLKKLFAPYGGE